MFYCVFFFFFFQAEDGIRDFHVTGVQTCALPIYERRTLKLLQWGQPRRHWRLKCPTHLLFLPHLDKAFPDARYVWTHRDPTEVILSVADLYAEFGQMTSNTVDRRYLGQLNVEQ